jgi:hypothetical protein
MKTTPILFSAEMVRALLDGRKTQTRRLIKPQPTGRGSSAHVEDKECCQLTYEAAYGVTKCPYGGCLGDLLWVKETYCIESNFNVENESVYPPPHRDGRPIVRLSDTEV